MARPSLAPGQRFLSGTAVLWYVVALVGQLAFIAYIIGFFGLRTLTGNYAGWNDKPSITGFVENDGLGNFMFITHVFGASVIALFGMLQLIPMIRQRAPAVHRWMGRSFMVMALLMASGGLMLTWARGSRLSDIGAIPISIDGILIIAFAIIAWRLAVKRRFDLHHRWALRAFMVANGVWFLRLFMMAWVILTQGAGMNQTMSGPADLAIQYGCYFGPLLVLELYFLASRNTSRAVKFAVGGVVILSTIVTAIGIFGAWMFMWGPRL